MTIARISPLGRVGARTDKLSRVTSLALSYKVLGALLTFGFNVALARWYGASGSGLFYIAFTVMSVASVLGRLGMDNAVMRFTAVEADQARPGKIRGLWRDVFVVACCSSVGLAILLAASGPLLANAGFGKPALARPLEILAAGVIPLSLITLEASALRGLRRVGRGVFLDTVAVQLLAITFLAVAHSSGAGIGGASVSYLVALVVALALGTVWISQWLRRGSVPTAHFDRRLLVKTTGPLLIVTLLDTLQTWVGILALGVLRTSAQAGVFAAALRTSILVSWMLQATNSYAAPKFAELHARRDLAGLAELYRKASRNSTVLVILPFMVLMAYSREILHVFGTGFRAGSTALAVLASAQLVNVAVGSVGYLLMMTGHERIQRNIFLASMALNLLLQAVLVPHFGVTGSAIATSSSLVSLNIAGAVYAYHRFGIVPWPVPQRRSRESAELE